MITFAIRSALVALSALLLIGCGVVDFSPDGRQVVFPWSDGNASKLAIIGIDGEGFRLLPGTDDADWPRWSPDGKTICYTKPSKGNDVYFHDVRSNLSRKFLPGEGAAYWSPDGTKILTGSRDGTRSINIRESNSGNLLGQVPLGELSPLPTFGWLPESNDLILLAWEGSEADPPMNLYLADSGQLVRLTSSSDVVGFSLSLDEQRVMWARYNRNVPGMPLTMYSMDLRTRGVRRERFAGPSIGAGGKIPWLAFSPDGSRILIPIHWQEKGQLRKTQLWACNVDCSGGRLLKEGGDYPEKIPWWSPDSRRVAVLEEDAKSTRLVLFDVVRGSRTVLKSRNN